MIFRREARGEKERGFWKAGALRTWGERLRLQKVGRV